MADDSGKITYFLAGIGLGTLIGVLFAPRAGEETREYLSSKAGEGRDYAIRRGREVKTQAEDFITKGKDALNRQKDNLQAAVEAGKRAYREAGGGSSGGSEPGSQPVPGA